MPTAWGPAALCLLRLISCCAALASGLALAGCAAGADTPAPTDGPHSARSAGHSGRHRRSTPRAPGGLPVSHASSTRVQPQPAPGSCHARGSGAFSLPDPHCTPGAVSPAVTQRTIASTICRSGYTDTVRPSESITEREKQASLIAYGDRRPLHAYEYDHLVALELGGAPNDPRNLWPEPGASPNPKDTLEGRLRRKVCDGQMSLAGAQRAIAGDWVKAYRASG